MLAISIQPTIDPAKADKSSQDGRQFLEFLVDSPGWFPRFRNRTVAKARGDNRFHLQVGRVSLGRNHIVVVFESLDENLTTLALRR